MVDLVRFYCYNCGWIIDLMITCCAQDARTSVAGGVLHAWCSSPPAVGRTPQCITVDNTTSI